MLEKNFSCTKEIEAQLAAFIAKFEDFKATSNDRLGQIEKKAVLCQTNPLTCATARKLEEHISADSGKMGKITGIIGCIISCISTAIVLITLVIKGTGK